MTLVELIIVIAIFVIMAGITMSDYGNFRTSVTLQNLADDIGLTIRKVQSNAIGVQSTTLLNFQKGFGIHFSTASSTTNIYAGWKKSIILFYDVNSFPDHKYTIPSSCAKVYAGDQVECSEVLDILTSDEVYAICPDNTSTAPDKVCAGTLDNSYVDITFLRPSPDATLCVGTVGSIFCNITYSSVDIFLKNSISGQMKKITVTNTGQISIE